MPKRRADNLTTLIKLWIMDAKGLWTSEQLDYEFNIESERDKTLRRGAVKQFCDAGICERIPNMGGSYRTLEGAT